MYTGTGLASAWETGLGDRKLRQLALAVLASLVLHLLILSLLASFQEFTRSRAAPPPLTARLAKPKPPPPPPEKVELPPPTVSPRAAATPKVAPQAPAPSPVPAAPILSMEPAKKSEAPALVVPPAPPQPVPRAEPTLVPPAASGPDPEAVKRFGIELREIAKRYKRYPRIARDNNWEGIVELGIVFGENGAVSLLSVKSSSGRAVLDEEAQAMLRSTIAQVAIPPALRGKAFRLDIPVRFSLEESR
jgi:protein TonB